MKRKFNPDLLLSESEAIIRKTGDGESPYSKIAQMLMGFKPRIRPVAVDLISKKFNLDESVLTERVKGEEFDEQAERDMLAKRKFTLSQYVNLLAERRNRAPRKNWNEYNGQTYDDPQMIILACIYDLLRHLAWKMTDSDHDIALASLVERDWDNAIQEMERRNTYVNPDRSKRKIPSKQRSSQNVVLPQK